MKKIDKEYIGLLDMGFEGIVLVDKLKERFPNESFIYINDAKHSPYDERSEEEVLECVSNSVAKLQEHNLKCLVVLNDSLSEYTLDYLHSLDVPIINLVDCVVKYVNKNLSKKNILYISRQSFIEANIIQKDISYNKLYVANGNSLIEYAEKHNVKTGESFNIVLSTVKPYLSKDIEWVITTSPSITLYITEFKEYLSECEVIDLESIISLEIEKKIKSNPSLEKKGFSYVILRDNDKDEINKFKEICNKHIYKCKYIL